MKTLTLLSAAVCLALSACKPNGAANTPNSDKSDALTRPLAQSLLKTYFSLNSSPLNRIQFIPEKLKAGVQAGVLEKQANSGFIASNDYVVSSKVMERCKTILADSSIRQDSVTGEFNIPLKSAMPQDVDEVTGIALSSDPNAATIEFTTAYLLPQELAELRPYLYTGHKAKATFRKFDDGWRVIDADWTR